MIIVAPCLCLSSDKVNWGQLQLDHTEFDLWLDNLPDEEISHFEETAAQVGAEWAEENHDLIAETCFEEFSGDNPKEWAQDAIDIISTSCKRMDETERVVKAVVSRTLERLGVKVSVG